MAETIFRQRRRAFPATAQADAWPRLRTGGRRKRTAGRLTKPPRSGRGRACPSAYAKAAGFVKRPSEPNGLRAAHSFGSVGNRHRTKGLRAGGPVRRDTGSSDPGPARQKARLRPARCHRLRRTFGSGGVGQDRASARELRTRRDPGLRLMARQAEPRLRPRIPPDAISRASVHEDADGREEGREFRIRRAANRQGFGPDGEPPGDTIRASARTDSGGRGAGTCPGYRPSKPPIAKGPLRRNRTRRDSGARQRCRAPLPFWGASARPVPRHSRASGNPGWLCAGHGRRRPLPYSGEGRSVGRKGRGCRGPRGWPALGLRRSTGPALAATPAGPARQCSGIEREASLDSRFRGNDGLCLATRQLSFARFLLLRAFA